MGRPKRDREEVRYGLALEMVGQEWRWARWVSACEQLAWAEDDNAIGCSNEVVCIFEGFSEAGVGVSGAVNSARDAGSTANARLFKTPLLTAAAAPLLVTSPSGRKQNGVGIEGGRGSQEVGSKTEFASEKAALNSSAVFS